MNAEALPIVAITGASGFTGGALASRLTSEGYHVRALSRRAPDDDVATRATDWLIGGLTDPDSIAQLVKGADTCFHIAAMYRTEGPAEEFLHINRDSTALLLKAARDAGVRRFVYCSSIGVHGDVHSGVADETAPFSPRDPYQQSKLLAEQLCREQMREPGMEIVVVRPCGIYGPGDTRMLKMFSMLQKGTFVYVGQGKSHFHPVYIDDLVEGFMLAMRQPAAAGQTFIIGAAEHLPLRDYVATAARALNVPAPKRHLPYGPVNAAARACELLCAPLNVEPPLHRRRLTFFKHHRAFTINRARSLLGYAPKVGLAEGFRRTVDWYRSEGMLR
ncbi:MAG: NAD-dependent epimerase/dehydratase family protein [Sphingobium sp.]|uniref:NAD-dependent epimerase/dehydratase family protein n=1 Tax=Sphingobium sp. TaxID=1912891 RepID=UPI0029A28723|nr:NAD-dependent epimerase/dehydratase family protein [Sphingobium sp.]MDX3908910.1 NAD-dependent epimerase/dehydratase family protein [Sphingobium sp.]